MSLIIDATRAAEREKQRRAASESRGGGPPLLVPLRAAPAPQFSWRRALVLGVSGTALLGAAAFVFLKTRDARQQPLALVSPPLIGALSAVDSGAERVPPGREEEAPAEQSPVPAPAPTRVVASVPGASAAPEIERAPARPQGEPAGNRVDSAADAAVPVQKAAGQLRIAVDAREADIAQIFAMGVAAHRAGRLDAARDAYERVLAVDRNHVDALNNLGVLLSATRELARAESVLRRAVQLAPDNAGAWSNLGTALAQEGQSGDAIAAYQHALRIDPAQPGARVSLAQQYLAIGSVSQARQLLEEVLASNSAMPEAHYAMGQVHEREQDWAAAIQSYSAFVRTAPGRLAAHVEQVRRRIEALSARVGSS